MTSTQATPLPTVCAVLEGTLDGASLRRALAPTILQTRLLTDVVLILDATRLAAARPDAASTLRDLLHETRGRWNAVVFLSPSRGWVNLAAGLSSSVGVPVRHLVSAHLLPGTVQQLSAAAAASRASVPPDATRTPLQRLWQVLHTPL